MDDIARRVSVSTPPAFVEGSQKDGLRLLPSVVIAMSVNFDAVRVGVHAATSAQYIEAVMAQDRSDMPRC